MYLRTISAASYISTRICRTQLSRVGRRSPKKTPMSCQLSIIRGSSMGFAASDMFLGQASRDKVAVPATACPSSSLKCWT